MDRSTPWISFSIIVAGIVIAGAIVFTRSQPTNPASFPTPQPMANTTEPSRRPTDYPPPAEGRMNPPAAMPAPSEPVADPDSAIAPSPSRKTFSYQRISFSYPGSWTINPQMDSSWSITEGSKNIGTLTCPIPEIGFQAWDFAQGLQERTFKKAGGADIRAQLWIAPPRNASTGLGWIARMTASEKDARDPNSLDVSKGCMARFQVANPPTDMERSALQAVYQSVQ